MPNDTQVQNDIQTPDIRHSWNEWEWNLILFELPSFFEFYLSVTLRVHFSVEFKRIFALHSFLKIFATLQCELEAR